MDCRGSLAWFGRQTHNVVSIDWNDYAEWINNNLSVKYAGDIIRYSIKYIDILQRPNTASKLMSLSKDKRRLIMASLSNLSKYLGIYEYWQYVVKNSGLKWEKRTALETFMSILDNNIDGTLEWLKDAIDKLPKTYGLVLTYITLSGLRSSEGIESARLIVELSETNKLNEYHDAELSMLMHFRYPQLFIRRNKNAFISFINKDLLDLILQLKPEITYASLDSRIGRLQLPNKSGELRKVWATTLSKTLPRPMIDLLQGRVSQDVFLRFYYKPVLQKIKNKVFRGLKPLQNELLQLLS